MWNIFPFSALEGTHELWFFLFFYFFQNLELSRWLQAVQNKLSWVKADGQVSALRRQRKSFDPSSYSWRRGCFQHWPIYWTPRRERDEPVPPAVYPTLLPKTWEAMVQPQELSFPIEKIIIIKKDSSKTFPQHYLSQDWPRVESGLQIKLPHPAGRN